MRHIHDVYDLYLKLENECVECKRFQDFIGYIVDMLEWKRINEIKATDQKEPQ